MEVNMEIENPWTALAQEKLPKAVVLASIIESTFSPNSNFLEYAKLEKIEHLFAAWREDSENLDEYQLLSIAEKYYLKQKRRIMDEQTKKDSSTKEAKKHAAPINYRQRLSEVFKIR